MRALAVHTVPVVDCGEGMRLIAMEEHCFGEDAVVGWCNVLDIYIEGEMHRLLVGPEADR